MTDNDLKKHSANEPQTAAINLALEGWRFANATTRIINKLSPSDQRRHHGQVAWFRGKIHTVLEQFGMHLVDLTGQRFESGMAVTVLNLEDFGPGEVLEIEQMIEPILMGKGGVMRVGTATVHKAE